MSSPGAPRLSVALEASTRSGSVAAALPGGPVHERVLDPERTHASDLLPALDGLLAELGTAPSDIDCVCVGTGPGSYTGLRVAVSLAHGMWRAGRTALVGVPSIEAELFRALEIGERGAALRDARGGRYTVGVYERDEHSMRTIETVRALYTEELCERLAPVRWPTEVRLFCEPAALRTLGALKVELPPLAELLPARAAAVLELGLSHLAEHGSMEPSEVLPLYLAPFAGASPGPPAGRKVQTR